MQPTFAPSANALTLRANSLGIFSMVWIIAMSGGVFLNSSEIVNITLLISAALVFAQSLIFIRRLRQRRVAMALACLVALLTCLMFSMLVNNDFSSVLTYLRLALVMALAFGTSGLLSNEQIVSVFVKTVVLLAAISILFFYLQIIEINPSLFPVISFYDKQFSNAFVYSSLLGLDRNTGIFTEPGLYQIYLSIALFVLLYFGRKVRHGNYCIAIVLVALFSTKSTTGFILVLIIAGGLAFLPGSHKFRLVFAAVRATLVVIAIWMVTNAQFFASNLEEKFSGTSQQSSLTRGNSTIIDLNIIRMNPLFGGGAGSYGGSLDKYKAEGLEIDAATNTYSQLGALIGLPFILIIVWRICLFGFRLPGGRVIKLVFLATYAICFSTQPFVLYPLFYLPVFMSFRAWNDASSRRGNQNSMKNSSSTASSRQDDGDVPLANCDGVVA